MAAGVCNWMAITKVDARSVEKVLMTTGEVKEPKTQLVTSIVRWSVKKQIGCSDGGSGRVLNDYFGRCCLGQLRARHQTLSFPPL